MMNMFDKLKFSNKENKKIYNERHMSLDKGIHARGKNTWV